jgi:hypothetical protein
MCFLIEKFRSFSAWELIRRTRFLRIPSEWAIVMLFREQINGRGVLIALRHCEEDRPDLSLAILRIDSDPERFFLRSNPSESQSLH